MKARDVMTAPIITCKSASVKEIAELFFQRHISAVPVVDEQDKLVGIISESDLMRRAESETERQRSWWLIMMTGRGPVTAVTLHDHILAFPLQAKWDPAASFATPNV